MKEVWPLKPLPYSVCLKVDSLFISSLIQGNEYNYNIIVNWLKVPLSDFLTKDCITSEQYGSI